LRNREKDEDVLNLMIPIIDDTIQIEKKRIIEDGEYMAKEFINEIQH